MSLPNNKGGSGSGNFDHEGRPGEIGGSGEGGDSGNDNDNDGSGGGGGGGGGNEQSESFIVKNREFLLTDVKENWSSEKARGIAEFAIDDAEAGKAICITNDDGKLMSVCSYKTTESYLKVDNLASGVKGYGKETMKSVCNVAVKSNLSMKLISESEAVGFYEKIGMTNVGSVFGGGTKFTWSIDAMKTFISGKTIDNEPKNGCFVKTDNKKSFEGELIMSLPNEVSKKIDTKEKQIRSNVFKEVSRIVEITENACKRLCDDVGFTFKSGYEKRIIERVTTTETPDRDGDIVRVKGVDNTDFRIEPVVLFAHDRYNFPVGRSLKEWIDNKIIGWKSQDLYFDNDIDPTGRSDLTFRMVSSGAMRGCSIGFIPVDAKYDHSPEEKKKMGLGQYSIEYLKINKLEHSACCVPANQEALALSLKSIDSKVLKGTLTKNDLDTLEKNNMLDGNMIDVFYHILGVEKTIVSLPVVTPEVKTEQSIVNFNIDMSKTNESIIEITKKITELDSNIDGIQKSLIERFNSLIAIAEKLTSAIEQKNESGKLYDQCNTKDIENILKLK